MRLYEPDRAEINRANSQHSTGPKTAEGKQKSALNALRHGLTGQIVVMPTEDLEAYKQHVDAFTSEYSPKGATEQHLVQALADTAWRQNRVASLEANLLTLAAARQPDPLSDDTPEQIQSTMAIAAALQSQAKAFSSLSLHSQRLSRQFERTAAQLQALQKTRLEKENWDLHRLVNIMEMYTRKGETYNPSADGFVFSQAQINEEIRSRRRQKLARKAHTAAG